MKRWHSAFAIFALAVLSPLLPGTAPPAQAEMFALPDCDGANGIGVVGYSRTEGPEVETLNELSEICWNAETATLTSQEGSRDLELTAQQGGTSSYQRLDGGSVSPLNEQLQVGTWESRPDGTLPYIRWTTEGSRSREDLGGYDYVTVEGFLAGEAGITPAPPSATYDVEMQVTGTGGSMMSMVFNMLLPMTGTVEVDGESLTLTMTDFMPGMMASNVDLAADLTERDGNYTGDSRLTMENELMAGAPDEMWKRLDLRLDEFATLFSGDEIAFVGSLIGEMETFGGQKSAPVTFSLVGSGSRR